MSQNEKIDLAALVKKSGLKRVDIAKQLGTNPSNITSWLNNPPRNIQLFMRMLVLINDTIKKNENVK